MAAPRDNTVYITAGLPATKRTDQLPGSKDNTVFITAGLSAGSAEGRGDMKLMGVGS